MSQELKELAFPAPLQKPPRGPQIPGSGVRDCHRSGSVAL